MDCIFGDGESQGLVHAVRQLAFAQDLHADESFAVGPQLGQDRQYRISRGVHANAGRIDSGQADVEPWAFGRHLHGLDGMATDAHAAHELLLFGLGQDIHRALGLLVPLGFHSPVKQDDVDVVRPHLLPETIQIGLHFVGGAGVGLGQDGDLFTRDFLQSELDGRMTAVGIGGVPEEHAVVVAVPPQVGDAAGAELSHLVGTMATAETAGADGHA